MSGAHTFHSILEYGSSNTDRKWMAYIENFESCLEFEDVTDEKKKRSALLAVGGAELRDILRTLDEDTPNTYDTAKAALGTYFKAKKKLTAERYRFFCMKPGSSTESHDHWITRLKTAGLDCEFDKIDLKEAIKLAVTMHTNSSKLQAEIIAQDMSYEKMVEKARAIELTKKEVEYMKQTEEAFKVEASAVDAVRRESKIQYKAGAGLGGGEGRSSHGQNFKTYFFPTTYQRKISDIIQITTTIVLSGLKPQKRSFVSFNSMNKLHEVQTCNQSYGSCEIFSANH